MNAHLGRVFGRFFVSVVIAVGAVSGFAQTNDNEAVQIVNGRDGVGQAQNIPVGVFQVDGKQLGSTASVKVASGYFVQFCAQKDGTGKCEAFGEGIHNLTTTEFNFIKVGKGAPPVTTVAPGAAVTGNPAVATPAGVRQVAAVTVFEQKGWGGRSQTFGPGMYRSYRGEFGKINDNQAMSAVVMKGYRARFCSDEGLSFRGAGDCEIHEEGKHNLRFANSISFIEVIDLSDTSPDDEKQPVILYEDPVQTGKMQGFDEGTFLAIDGQFKKLGDDQAASISVKNGYRAMVCSDAPAAGVEPVGCEEFSAGKKNLKNRKAASYLKVWKDSK